jgi:DNA polymerase III sliding clamp (beta) subunit (PCNA family)
MPSVTVSADHLQRAMNAAKSIVIGRTDNQLLQCVAIKASGNVLRLEATDLTHGIIASIPCEGQGEWALSFDRLRGFVDAVKKGAVITISGDHTATLRGGPVTARILSLRHSDFPEMPKSAALSDGPQWSAPVFAGLFARVASACEERAGMSYSRAVHVKASGCNGVMTGVSGFVLARQDFVTEAPCEIDLMIDKDCASIFSSLFGAGPVWLGQDGGLLWVRNDALSYYTKTLDMRHPRSFNDLEATKQNVTTVDAASLMSAIKSAQAITGGKERKIIVNISDIGNFVAGIDGTETLCVPFDCEGDGTMCEMMNADHLRAFIASNGSDTIQMTFCEGTEKIPQRHLQSWRDGYLAFVMPMLSNASEIQPAIDAFTSGKIESVAA